MKIKIKHSTEMVITLLFDVLCFYTALIFAYYFRLYILPAYFFKPYYSFKHPLMQYIRYWWFPLVVIGNFFIHNLYKFRYPFWDEAGRIIRSVLQSSIIMLSIITLGKISNEVSRFLMVIMTVFAVFLFPLSRLFLKKILYRFTYFQRNIIIIGEIEECMLLKIGIFREKHLGFKIIGFFLIDASRKSSALRSFLKECKKDSITVYSNIKNLLSVVDTHFIETIFIAENIRLKEIINLVYIRSKNTGLNINIVPKLKGVALMNTELLHLLNEEIFILDIVDNLKSRVNIIIKNTFDYVLAVVLTVLSIPFMLAVGILIKIDSRGPVFFSHGRVGRGGRKIAIYKFRTMYEDAEERLKKILKNKKFKTEYNTYYKLKKDPRITTIGKFLRRTSLDELPQLFNVIKGEMAIVGPRPVKEEELIKYYKVYREYYESVKPGITGMWQISGRNDLTYEERVRYDVNYVMNWSLWLDIILLLKTVRILFRSEGAY
ncbi:sugar transferase [Spirochaetota bacterium]